jgi:hypothetical protein
MSRILYLRNQACVLEHGLSGLLSAGPAAGGGNGRRRGGGGGGAAGEHAPGDPGQDGGAAAQHPGRFPLHAVHRPAGRLPPPATLGAAARMGGRGGQPPSPLLPARRCAVRSCMAGSAGRVSRRGRGRGACRWPRGRCPQYITRQHRLRIRARVGSGPSLAWDARHARAGPPACARPAV